MGSRGEKGKDIQHTSLNEFELLPLPAPPNSVLPLPEFVKTIYPNLRGDQKMKLARGKLLAINVKDDESGKSYYMQLERDHQGYKFLGAASLLRDRGMSATNNEAKVSCIDGQLHFSLVK